MKISKKIKTKLMFYIFEFKTYNPFDIPPDDAFWFVLAHDFKSENFTREEALSCIAEIRKEFQSEEYTEEYENYKEKKLNTLKRFLRDSANDLPSHLSLKDKAELIYYANLDTFIRLPFLNPLTHLKFIDDTLKETE